MSDFDFGEPIPVDSLPPATRGGRTSREPAFRAWLDKLQPNATYELASADEDGGHPVSRVTQLRKIAGDGYKVDTRAIPGESGKRYKIYVTKIDPAKAKNATPAKK